MSVYPEAAATSATQTTPESDPGLSLQDRAVNYADRQLDRARRLHTMLKLVGVENTARIVVDRLAHTRLSEEHEIDLGDPILGQPLRLTTSASDLHGYHEIVRDRVYALPEGADAGIDGRPIVDLGAYIGMSAVFFATRYPNSNILAIEPHPRNYRLLSANAARYDGRIKTARAAFSLDGGPTTMTHNDPPGVSHMSNVFLGETDAAGATASSAGNPVVAEGITPDGILDAISPESRIGILKVDIEGAENLIFRAAAVDPLLQRTDMLMIETHDRFEVGRGSTEAVADATTRNGLELADFSNGHTATYVR